MSETARSRKTEKAQLENLLSEYFRTRSLYPYGEVRGNDSPTFKQDNHVQQKYNKLQPSLFEFKTFCSMTSLHGFIHFKENSFNKIGKFFWATFLVAIYALSFVAVYMLIFILREKPAIISLDNTVSSVWTIPFPAVTVCSANTVRPSVYNYLDTNNNTDYEDQLIQNTVHSVCEKNPVQKNLKLSVDFLDSSFVSQVLKNLSFPCEKIIKWFYWLHSSEKDPCNIWFQETFTSYGLCYSFNMMPMGDLLTGVDEWSQENNHNWKNYQSSWQPDTGYYSNDVPITRLPMRTFGDSDYYSVAMVLDLHTEDFSNKCSQGLEIFYILIHSPAEWPDRSHPTLLASANSLKTIGVKPIVLTTSQELMSWDPIKRHCYFQNERKLKFFKVYTKKNCMLECQSSYALEQCGCVPFYHLRIKNTPICGPAKMTCWVIASQSPSDSCECLPDCTELYFESSSLVAHYNKMTEMNNSSLTFTGSTFISIYYQNRNYIGLDRITTYTFQEFIGDVGGIMGLCLGFSLLSLAEIIYFLTLRPLVNYCNSKRKMKKVDPTRISENNLELTNNDTFTEIVETGLH